MNSSKSCNHYCFFKTRGRSERRQRRLQTLQVVIFDMDGVLADVQSSWRYIHEHFGSSNQRSVTQYLQGQISDEEFIRRDVSLWKEDGKLITEAKLIHILSKIQLVKGARECLSFLQTQKIKTSIISAGLYHLARRIADELRIDYVYANEIQRAKDGRLTDQGIIHVPLMYKDRIVHQLVHDTGIPLKNMAAVGNSCFDIPMLQLCGLGIAFNPEDECIKKEADIVIENDNLTRLNLLFQKYIA